MKSLSKVTRLFTLLSFLILVSFMQVVAQNTAPVPTTFEILSPSDGNLPNIINHDYGTALSTENSRIFYGGDFARAYMGSGTLDPLLKPHHIYLGWAETSADNIADQGEVKARGNSPDSRLTLGGREWFGDIAEPAFGVKANTSGSRVVNLGYSHTSALNSTDVDDLGQHAATWLCYTGCNGFIAINEEDSLIIRLTGYVDPNNMIKYAYDGTAIAGDNIYAGGITESMEYDFDIANPVNGGENGVEFGVIPSTLPAKASFNTNLFVWVPNFIQGDGRSDNSVRNGYYFVDANISDGLTTSQENGTVAARLDSSGVTGYSTRVGYGVGELRDSLYVVYFTALDDGIPPMTGTDSLFIMVNDSIENPAPVFSQRDVINRDGTTQSYLQNSMDFTPDSILSYTEGDSIVITFHATDQDSIRGGDTNDELAFLLTDWADFVHRTFTGIDSSVALDTSSIGSPPTAFRVRINLAYNLGIESADSIADTLIVQTTDGTATIYDTMLFKVINRNRAPIWDQDTLTKPADSTLKWAYQPELVDPDSIESFYTIAVANNRVDTLYMDRYVYDPDPLIGDSLGWTLAITQSGAPADVFNSTGLMVLNISVPDTISYAFTITATDNADAPESASVNLVLRVAPEPEIDRTFPESEAPGMPLTIFGEGFGLYDDDVTPPSRVRFRARQYPGGPARNLVATVNSWSRDRINIIIPSSCAPSFWDTTNSDYIPDTIEVNSAVFTTPTYYTFVVSASDSMKISELEVVNLTSTSAVIKWKTQFTGIDSIVMGTSMDTLDVFSTGTGYWGAPATIGGNWPTFTVPAPGTALSQVKTNVTRFTGSSTPSDQIHYVELKDLTPGTLYKFFIGMENNIFFGDSAHNENGPWRPAKIDRTNSGTGVDEVNRNVCGFRLRTLPAQGNGVNHIVYGKVFTSSGSATNALVTVKVVNKDNAADSSVGLTVVVSSDSTWQVNLADAVKDTSLVQNRVYPFKTGDHLLITVRGDNDIGFVQFTDTVKASGFSPQQVGNLVTGGTLLIPSVDYDIRMRVGLNLIGLPVQPLATEPQDAYGILNRLGNGASSITRYISDTGTRETIIKSTSASGSGFSGASNFNVELYSGYFVKVDGLEYLNIEGTVFGDSLTPVEFSHGGNLYWISRPAQESQYFYSWSARTMLTKIEHSAEIFRFEENIQAYENAFKDQTTGQFIGTDFHIDVSEGYILRVTANSSWDPRIPTTVLLAAASEKFDYITDLAPAITLNTAKKAVAGTGAVRVVRLTDVSSSAAKVSWVTDGIDSEALVRYGKADKGLNQVAYFDSETVDRGMRLVTLLGLEKDTDYIYEIVSNGVTYNDNGQPYIFRSAKVDIGIPYSVFGRLVDQSGDPLARTLVYLEAMRGEARSTSLVAVTDDRGYWSVNLANLKTASGEVYPWNVNDELRVTAIYEDASVAFRTLVSGQSPQNVVRVSDDETATASKKEVSRISLPKAFALGQNYPNPFNPSTTIAFDIPDTRNEGVNVQLNIYNIRGQLVRAMVNETKKPGRYTIQWDGRSEKGDVVSSGVYFYRIKAGDYVSTRKMVLLK